MKVVFSKRAMTALLVETGEKITTETGGVLLGNYKDGIWYVVETIDPGPGSIFKAAYFEYDQAYINHLINKVSRLYKNPLDLIGLWHRHPGSLDSFSMTDDGTNLNYAKLSENGAISGLVNIDPVFRLTIYHVAAPLQYMKLSYEVDDRLIPQEFTELKEPGEYAALLGKMHASAERPKEKAFTEIFKGTRSESVNRAIQGYLKDKTIANAKVLNARGYEGELPVEAVLESLEADLKYLEECKIRYTLTLGKSGLLDLILDERDDKLHLVFGMDDQDVVFVYDKITYKYQPGIFQKAIRDADRRNSK